MSFFFRRVDRSFKLVLNKANIVLGIVRRYRKFCFNVFVRIDRFRRHLGNIGYSVSPVPTAGDVSTTEFVACFYFKLISVTTAKK